jgi:NAD(P)-dependent dehydrogenase (short-subunit alcohol dehydrogenase family)
MPETGLKNASTRKAYIITGPTSGIGRATALELAKHAAQTGAYYDEGGHPMQGSALVRDLKFQDRVVAETRALLSTIQAS